MVIFESPAPAAVRALATGELRNRAQVECGAQLHGLIAAKTFDGVNVDPIVQHRLEKGVPGEFRGQIHGNRATIDDVTDLPRMGMAASPGKEIAHDHQLGPVGPLLHVAAATEPGQGVSGMTVPRLGRGIVSLAGGAAGPAGGQLDAPHERKPGLGRKGAAKAHHAQPVTPVPKESGLLLLVV
jgi:hypothetical protein